MKPNIIEFIWHDLGDWLSCYNRKAVQTPNLDRLYNEGALFENNFCNAPQCTPSRACIKTGVYPPQHGLLGLSHRGWEYKETAVEMPEYFEREGYRTVLCGLQHEHHHPKDSYLYTGPDPLIPYKYQERWTCKTTSQVVADIFLEKLAAEKTALQDSPFFMSIGFSAVHRLYANDYNASILNEIEVPKFLPDDEATRKDLATFIYRIEQADKDLGRILDGLEDAGLSENTLIYFTSDHGPEVPRAKASLYDPGLKTALLMRCPGRIAAGQRIQGLTSGVDILPTLLDAIGAAKPDFLEGQSFWPEVSGEGTVTPRERIFAQMTYHSGEYDPMRCIRTERYKLIRNYIPGWPVQISGPYAARFGAKYVETHFAKARPEWELYDLKNDPDEFKNLVGHAEYEATEQSLKTELMDFLKRTGDPILKGQIPNIAPEKAGCACRWAKFQPRHPEREEYQFELVVTEDFGEQPI